MRSYARKRRTNKPQALVELAGKLHVEGKSNREIARALAVHHDTVPSMLAESEIVRGFRQRLLRQVPRLLKNFKLLTTPGTPDLTIEELGRNTRWGLEQTQIGFKREAHEHEVYDPLSALTDEELATLRRKVEDVIRSGELAAKDRRRRGAARKARKNPEG